LTSRGSIFKFINMIYVISVSLAKFEYVYFFKVYDIWVPRARSIVLVKNHIFISGEIRIWIFFYLFVQKNYDKSLTRRVK